MSRVCLIFESTICDSHDPVKDSYFVVTSAADPKSPAEFQLKMLCQFGFVLVDIDVIAQASEIIAMDDDCQITVSMMEDAWRCDSAFESHRF